MRHFFLVDYENVKEKGLDGFFALTRRDTVYVFYSVNQQKISMDFVSDLKTRKRLPMIEYVFVKAGKQSLDMQLSSFLGALIAEHGTRRCDYTIVSADRDFLTVVDFWNRRKNTSCVREFASIERFLKKDTVTEEVHVMKEKTPVAGRVPASATAHYEKGTRAHEERKPDQRRERNDREKGSAEKQGSSKNRNQYAKTEKTDKPKAAEAEAKEAPVIMTPASEPEAKAPEKTEKPAKTRKPRAERPVRNEKKEEPVRTEETPETAGDAAEAVPGLTADNKDAAALEERPSEAASPVKDTAAEPVPETEEKKTEETSLDKASEDPGKEDTDEKKPVKKAPAKKRKAPAKQAEKPAAAESPETDTAPAAAVNPPSGKTLLNNRLQSALAKAQIDQKVAIEITHMVLSHMDEKNFKQIVYLEMIKKYRQADGLNYYRIIQPVMQDAV